MTTVLTIKVWATLALGIYDNVIAENTKGGRITLPLTSCLTGLDKSVLQIKTKIGSCHTADSE